MRLVIGAALAFGAATGVMALMPTYYTYMLACIPVGFASLTMMTAANATIQMSTDPAMRGRVMSLYMAVFLGATPVGSPVVGWIAETFGARWAIGIGSISAILVAGVAALWAMRHWHVQVRYRLAARPHLEVRHLRREEEERARTETADALGAQEAGGRSTAA